MPSLKANLKTFPGLHISQHLFFATSFAVTKPIYVFFLRERQKKYMIGYYTIVFSCYFDRLTFFFSTFEIINYIKKDYFL
jgi:hypothetical protein